MTDQEQISNASSAGGSAVVLVEKKTASRHKPFRPTDLPDDAQVELHHKRSRAPAVPSVAEEYKDSSGNTIIKEKKESEHVKSSEKPKHVVGKISSKRATSPEAIAMAPIEVDLQRADIHPPATQPIPPPVGPAASDISTTKEVSENDDSITEEIAELRTVESSHKEWDTEHRIQEYVPENPETEATIPLQRKLASEINKIMDSTSQELYSIQNLNFEQCCEGDAVRCGCIDDVLSIISNKVQDNETENKNDVPTVRESEVKIPLQRKLACGSVNEGITSTNQLKKKEISWTQPAYLDKVQLQNLNTRSVAWILDRKASIGPCFRKTLPYGEPSGIFICLPKKSLKSCNEIIKPNKSGGISINVSKRCLDNNANLSSDFEMRNRADRVVFPRRENRIEIKIEEGNCENYLENLKGKLDSWREKIKHVLHM